MADNLRFWILSLCVFAAILFVGWKQPLRYRFLSAQDIWAIEHPEPPAPPSSSVERAKDNSWMFDPRRQTLLDREATRAGGAPGGSMRTGPQTSNRPSR